MTSIPTILIKVRCLQMQCRIDLSWFVKPQLLGAWFLVGLLLVLGPVIPALGDVSPGYHKGLMFVHDGIERQYDLYVPAGYDGSTSVPLILDAHGWRYSSTSQKLLSGFDRIADAENLLVVYPQGTGNSWNIESKCCPPASNDGIDDLVFMLALIATIKSEANIDSSRIYATGYSLGGDLRHGWPAKRRTRSQQWRSSLRRNRGMTPCPTFRARPLGLSRLCHCTVTPMNSHPMMVEF